MSRSDGLATSGMGTWAHLGVRRHGRHGSGRTRGCGGAGPHSSPIPRLHRPSLPRGDRKIAEVVEVAPAYDHAEITNGAEATVVFDLITLLARSSQEVAEPPDVEGL
jgi:hypothetical protein